MLHDYFKIYVVYVVKVLVLMMIAIVDTVKTARKRLMMKGGAKIGEKGNFFTTILMIGGSSLNST